MKNLFLHIIIIMNSNVYFCFLDASKVFDCINHNNVFKKLHDRHVPLFLIRILIY